MTHRRLLTLAALTALTLAACGENPKTAEASEAPSAKIAAPPSAPKADTGLEAYVDHYPFDVVNGVTWNDHPVVKAGLAKTVTNAEIRRTIETLAGPSAPIESYEGKLMSWACETHNCGPHQWSVLIDPSSGATDVCYYNESINRSRAHWFFAGGTEQWRDGTCQLKED